MLVLEWKERAFIEKVNSRCFCWFPAAILVDQNGPPIWRLLAWNVSANNSETVGHKDLRLGQTVCIFFFYNISFSWLLQVDGFQFIFWLRDSENDLYKCPLIEPLTMTARRVQRSSVHLVLFLILFLILETQKTSNKVPHGGSSLITALKLRGRAQISQRVHRLHRSAHRATPLAPCLRWLDWIFWGGYLPSLSINYVAMSKDMEKRFPQLYYIKMKISYDLGFIAIGVAMAT